MNAREPTDRVAQNLGDEGVAALELAAGGLPQIVDANEGSVSAAPCQRAGSSEQRPRHEDIGRARGKNISARRIEDSESDETNLAQTSQIATVEVWRKLHVYPILYLDGLTSVGPLAETCEFRVEVQDHASRSPREACSSEPQLTARECSDREGDKCTELDGATQSNEARDGPLATRHDVDAVGDFAREVSDECSSREDATYRNLGKPKSRYR